MMTGKEKYQRYKEYSSNYNKEVRVWRKAHGFCTMCGHEKAAEGRVTCDACAEKQRVQARERYYRRRAKKNDQLRKVQN